MKKKILDLFGLLRRFDWGKLATRERVLVVITGCAVLLGMIVMLLLPVQKRTEQKEARIETLNREINQTRASLSDLSARVGEVRAAAENRVDRPEGMVSVSDVIMGANNLPSFFDDLTRLGRKHGMDFLLLRPESFDDRGDYFEMNLKITVKSRFRQLGEYLRTLEDLPRALIVKDIKIESSTETTPYITADLKMTTYMAKN